MSQQVTEHDPSLESASVTETLTPEAAPPRRGPGAPKGNRNHLRHGLRSLLVVGQYPKGCHYLKGRISAFRTALEARVVEVDGELTLMTASLCQSAAQHEGRRSLAMRWLAEAADTLPALDRLAFLRDASAAADARDAVLRKLGLDHHDPRAPIVLPTATRPPASPPVEAAAAAPTEPPAIGEPIGDQYARETFSTTPEQES